MIITAVLPSELPPPVVLDPGWEPAAPDVPATAHLFTVIVASLAVAAWWRVLLPRRRV
jgi:hypothetical protein